MPRTLASSLALACVLAVVSVPLLSTRNDPGIPLDEGLLLVEPERVLEGDLPYRDFESFYGPANTLLLAAVYEVVGPSVDWERAVGFGYRLAVVAMVFMLAAFAGVAAAIAAGLIAGLLVFTGLAAFAWYGGLALALASLWLLIRALRVDSTPRHELALAGIAAGLAISYRPQFAIALGLAALPLLAWRPLSLTRRFAGWTLLGATPLLAVAVAAGPGRMFESLVVDALLRSGPQSTLPLPEEGFAVRLLALLAAGTIVLIGAAAIAWRRAPRGAEARWAAAVALLSVGLLPQTLGRPDAGHILQVGCVTVALVPAVLCLRVLLGGAGARARSLAVGLTATGVTALTWSSQLEGVRHGFERVLGISETPIEMAYDANETWIDAEGRSFPLDKSINVLQTDATLSRIYEFTEPGDRILVGPDDLRRTFYNHTFLYYLLPDLEPATYYLTMAPGTANREGSGLAEDVASADVVVLGTGADWRRIAPESELGDDAASEVLRRQFCLRSEFGYRVYTPCREGEKHPERPGAADA